MELHTRIGVLVACLTCVLSAQNAELNAVLDDGGEIYLNGEQVTMPPRLLDTARGDTIAAPVTVRPGTNVLALHCRDGGWTGGFCASIDLNSVGVAETLITDASWMSTHIMPATDDWKDSTFDETGWIPAGDYGVLADDTGGNPKPFFERSGLEPYNLWSHKTHWLWTPNPVYIRKSFTRSGAGNGSVMVRGNGFSFRMYLNGQLVGEKATEQDYSDPLNRFDNVAMLDGENVVAIEASCVDSIDFAFLKANVQWGPQDYVYSDTTWTFSYELQSGWNDVGFDDAGWAHIGMKTQYDGTTDAVTAADWIWATDMWVRKEFVLPAELFVSSPGPGRVTTRSAPAVVNYYTLQGKRVDRQTLRTATGAIVERRIMADGTVQIRRVGHMR